MHGIIVIYVFDLRNFSMYQAIASSIADHDIEFVVTYRKTAAFMTSKRYNLILLITFLWHKFVLRISTEKEIAWTTMNWSYKKQ